MTEGSKYDWIDVDFDGTPLKAVDVSVMSREQWLEFRTACFGIGGSDIGTVCGVNPYKDPITLWYEKIGLKDPRWKQNKFTAWGILTEEATISALEYHDGEDWVPNWERNRKVREIISPPHTYWNPDFPWFYMNLDGRCVSDPDRQGDGIVEIKQIGGHYSDKWLAGVPPPYWYQLIGYVVGTGTDWGMIALKKDGVDLIVRYVDRYSDAFQRYKSHILHSCERFYAAMLEGKLIVDSDLTQDEKFAKLWEIEDKYEDVLSVTAHDALGSWYSEQQSLRESLLEINADGVEGWTDLKEWAEQRKELDLKIAQLKSDRDLLNNKIRKLMRNNGVGRLIWPSEGMSISFRKSLRINKKT